MTTDPDILRVSKRQLRKLLVDVLAPKRAADILRELEERPEGEIPRGKPSDEARTLASMDFGRPQRARRA